MIDKTLLWIVFVWLIVCIVWFGWKWIKERRNKVNYIDVFKSIEKGKHFNGRFKL